MTTQLAAKLRLRTRIYMRMRKARVGSGVVRMPTLRTYVRTYVRAGLRQSGNEIIVGWGMRGLHAG